MFELANNYKGHQFVPPASAAYWRVRKMRDGQRGQLDLVRDAGGRPLDVAIDATVEDFRSAVGDVPGRYRLDALDEQRIALDDAEPAYVLVAAPATAAAAADVETLDEVDGFAGRPQAARPGAPLRNAAPVTPPVGSVMPLPGTTVTAPFGTWPALPMPTAMSGTEYLLAEAMRGQVLMFQSLTAALAHQGATSAAGASQMMGSAAELLRAADGAGLTRRWPPQPAPPPAPSPVPPPLAPVPVGPDAPEGAQPRNAGPEGEVDDSQDHEASPWAHACDQDGEGDDDGDEADDGEADDQENDADIMSRLMTLADKVQGALAPVADVARLVVGGFGGGGLRNAQGEAVVEDGAADGEGGTEVAPPPAPVVPAYLRVSHMQAIGYELGPQGSRFRRIVMAMEPAEQKALTDHLCSMPLDRAVADVRAKLAAIPAPQRARVAAPTVGTGPAVVSGPVIVVEPTHVVVEGAAQSESGEPRKAQVASEVAARKPEGDEADGHDDGPEAPGAVASAADVTTPVPGPAATPPARDPDAKAAPADLQAQMLQIARHLSMPEILRAQALAASLSADDRAAWLARLAGLSPARAAKVIRAELARR